MPPSQVQAPRRRALVRAVPTTAHSDDQENFDIYVGGTGTTTDSETGLTDPSIHAVQPSLRSSLYSLHFFFY
jgi:hypothetical protein